MNARYAGRQRGMTLIVALIMLILMTLFTVTSFNLGKSSLLVVGNMQQRAQAMSAAQGTIEEVISSITFVNTPANALANPYLGTPNTRGVDVNGDGVVDVVVTLSPPPVCIASQVIKNDKLDLANTLDAGCSTGVSQSFGVEGVAAGDSLCANTMWEINAVAVDSVTQARAVQVQGVTVRVLSGNLKITCP